MYHDSHIYIPLRYCSSFSNITDLLPCIPVPAGGMEPPLEGNHSGPGAKDLAGPL